MESQFHRIQIVSRLVRPFVLVLALGPGQTQEDVPGAGLAEAKFLIVFDVISIVRQSSSGVRAASFPFRSTFCV